MGDIYRRGRHEDAGPDGPDRRRRHRARRTSGSAAQSSRICTAAAGIPRPAWQDQDKDGVAAEIIYPTVGMLICNHPDFDFKKACFDAYNRWLQGYCARAP